MTSSWEKVAGWYDNLLAGEGTYQRNLILPNLLRLLEPRRGETILDLACGQGFFAHEIAKAGAHVIGIDVSKRLIALAKKNNRGTDTEFFVGKADRVSFLKNKSIDKIIIVLAIQNIESTAGVLKECARVLKSDGSLHIVLNHPAFRIPKESSWGWDEQAKVQYRRIDQYLSESKTAITMHPGSKASETTTSFHRPLQFYFKALAKAGFATTVVEEWNSHKKSEPGPRAKAEDRARKEIPLFMAIIARRMA